MRCFIRLFQCAALVLAIGCSSGGGGGGGFSDAGNLGGFGASGGFGAFGGSTGGVGASAGTGGAEIGGSAGAGGSDVPCANGGTRCNGVCVDTTNDPLHCGSCTTVCASGELCQNSACATAPDCHTTPCTGLTYCDLASGLCKPGCLTDPQCGANEVCNTATHACDCSPGYTRYPSGVCGTGCEINGIEVSAGAPNGPNTCQVCKPDQSNSTWTNVNDSTSCGANLFCYGGQCVPCLNGSSCTPSNACHDGVQQCSAASANCADTGNSKPNGTNCGAGKVCNSGTCQSGCFVSGTFYASGAASPSTSCQTCQPSVSTTSFTSVAEGTSCGSGKVCHTGACATGCYIGGAYYTAGQQSPSDPCKVCTPSSSTTSFTSVATGTSCATGKVCSSSGACTTGCYINNTFYAANAVDPTNGCRACLPDKSTSTFSNDDGAQCASDSVCFQGSCQKGCWCPTQFTTPAVIAPGTTGNYGCAVCDPTKVGTCWSPNPYGGTCWYPSGCCGYCGGATCNFIGCGSYCP